MTTAEPALDVGRRPTRRRVGLARTGAGTGIGVGLATMYLSIVVLLPLSAVVLHGFDDGISGFWDAITQPAAWHALELTVGAGLFVALVNAVLGTLTAWVLVRDKFPGMRVLEALVDLPFALPTIVAGIVLL